MRWFSALIEALLDVGAHMTPDGPQPTALPAPPTSPASTPSPVPFWAKFDPRENPATKGAAMSEPITSPSIEALAARPSDAALAARVTALMLAQNHKIPFVLGITEYHVPLKGVTIHKLDDATAGTLAQIVLAVVGEDFPLAYALACLCIESCFDPGCVNMNEGPGESNTAKEPGGGDYGVAQLKAKYLVGQEGLSSVEAAIAFALDPARALPYFARVMRGRLAAADHLIATLPPSANAVYRNRFASATNLYQLGLTGGSAVARRDAPVPNHVVHVAHLEAAFAMTLGTQPVMPAL